MRGRWMVDSVQVLLMMTILGLLTGGLVSLALYLGLWALFPQYFPPTWHEARAIAPTLISSVFIVVEAGIAARMSSSLLLDWYAYHQPV